MSSRPMPSPAPRPSPRHTAAMVSARKMQRVRGSYSGGGWFSQEDSDAIAGSSLTLMSQSQATQKAFTEEASTMSPPLATPEAPKCFGRLVALGELAKSQGPVSMFDQCIIGRGSACQVRIVDLTVSSQHCKIMVDGANGMPFVVDYTSSNGTFVNHRAVRLAPGRMHYLIHGDRISLIGPYGKGVAPPLFSTTNQAPRTGFEFVFTTEDENLIPDPAASALASKVGGAPSRLFYANPRRIDLQVPVLDEKYGLVRELGRGNFATVYRAVSRNTGEQVAIKVIERSRFLNMSPQRWAEQIKEAETLRKLNHRGIVSFRDLLQTQDRLFVVTELLQGGELYNRLVSKGAFPEAVGRSLMRRIVEAVAYLHEQGIVHRDLKPENILLQSENDDVNVKLVDFGVATEESNGRKTFCGSMSYLAPEVLSRRRGAAMGQSTYGKGVDMWSVGVICHVVLSLRPPFDEEENSQMHGSIRDVLRFSGPEWTRVSSEAKDFISKCLEMSEGKRLTAAGALKHPWLADVR